MIHTLNQPSDIPNDYQNTPIADLIAYHNFGADFKSYETADLIIGMCMDHRKSLRVPENFAYILRSGGANFKHHEFKISFAVSIAGVEHIALIGHTLCGMVNLSEKKEAFVEGMVKTAGWDAADAQAHFEQNVGQFELASAEDFILSESKRLSKKYPRITFAPLLYKVEDNRLYWLSDD